MKKFYILLIALPVLAATLFYLPVGWFIGGVAFAMAFVAWQFYAERLKATRDRTEVLEKEIEDLHVMLEKAVVKEQKTSKEAENVRLAKQQLLSVISHEVRTPMNGILGTTLLMQETSLTKEQEDHLTTIRNCGESLVTTVNNILVNDILDLSKIHQDGNKLEYKDFNLRDTVEEVLELFTEKAGKAGIDLLYNIDESVPVQIIGDSKRLRQILMNLVENAVKFTNRGEVLVELHYTSHTSTGHPPELTFEVKDSGIGISKEQAKQLFAGMPGKKQKTNEIETGLGLVICKKLVDLMGGTIELKSEPGKGSTFAFTLPVTPSLKAVRSDARENEMNILHDKHILIVDDNAVSRSVLASQFKSWQMIPAVGSANDIMEKLSANRNISIVIIDTNLAGTDSFELTKSIKHQYPAISIIGMKPAGDKNYRNDPDVFAGIINKPIRQHLLRDLILNVFSQPTSEKQKESTPMSDLFAAQYPLNILVAEDNPLNQKIANKILTSLGYKPQIANNGKEAIEMAGHEEFDIILMDVQMPEMDGMEATRMIRTCLQVQPVIIALTANVMQGDRDACMQAGMDDYMSKPMQLKELLNQLEKWYRASKDKQRASA